jgi:hypothetical protein
MLKLDEKLRLLVANHYLSMYTAINNQYYIAILLFMHVERYNYVDMVMFYKWKLLANFFWDEYITLTSLKIIISIHTDMH